MPQESFDEAEVGSLFALTSLANEPFAMFERRKQSWKAATAAGTALPGPPRPLAEGAPEPFKFVDSDGSPIIGDPSAATDDSVDMSIELAVVKDATLTLSTKKMFLQTLNTKLQLQLHDKQQRVLAAGLQPASQPAVQIRKFKLEQVRIAS